MCNEAFTFQELDLKEQELRRQLSELEDIRFAMSHDPAFQMMRRSPAAALSPHPFVDADFHRRMWADAIHEGVLTMQSDGVIDNCNARFAEFVDQPVEVLAGSLFSSWVIAEEQPALHAMLSQAHAEPLQGEFHLLSSHDVVKPVQIVIRPFNSENYSGACVVVTDLTQRDQPLMDELHPAIYQPDHSDRLNFAANLFAPVLAANQAAGNGHLSESKKIRG